MNLVEKKKLLLQIVSRKCYLYIQNNYGNSNYVVLFVNVYVLKTESHTILFIFMLNVSFENVFDTSSVLSQKPYTLI